MRCKLLLGLMVLGLAAGQACAIDRQVAIGEGTDIPDAGPADVAHSDVTGTDSSPGIDAGGSPDAGFVDAGFVDGALPDTGTPCSRADQRCQGSQRLLCDDGVLRPEDCGEEQRCEESDSGPICVDFDCLPSSSVCVADDTVASECGADGRLLAPVPCARGCADGSCRPETACEEDILETLAVGSRRVNLCAQSSDHDYRNSVDGTDDCIYAPTTEDVMYRLELDRPRRVRVRAADVDAEAAVDVIVYLRSSCGDIDSQIVCDEDSGPGQNAVFERMLEAGDYFLVVDSDEWNDYTCGNVEVTVEYVE